MSCLDVFGLLDVLPMDEGGRSLGLSSNDDGCLSKAEDAGLDLTSRTTSDPCVVATENLLPAVIIRAVAAKDSLRFAWNKI